MRNIGQHSTKKVPPFVKKLYNILQDSQYASCIHWVDSQGIFIIENVNTFTNEVMPKFFKHQNFCSIIRQLNMYGFQKARLGESENAYHNPNFVQGKKELLQKIHRKSIQSQKSKFQHLKDKLALEAQSWKLATNSQNLEKSQKQLIKANFQFIEENEKNMQLIQRKSKQDNRKMEKLLVYMIMSRTNNNISLPHRWADKIGNLIKQHQLGEKQEIFACLKQESNEPIIEQESLHEENYEEFLNNKNIVMDPNNLFDHKLDNDFSSELSLSDFLDL